MGKLPITSSLKRTAFQLRSVAKQTKKGKLGEIATDGGSTDGSTETIETKSIKKGQEVEKFLRPEDFEGGAKNPEYIEKKKALDDAVAKGADEKYKDQEVIEKKTIDKPGVDFDVDYKQENKGRSLTFDQTREKKLNNTYINKRLRKSKIKEANLRRKTNEDTAKYDTDGDNKLSDEEISKMSKGFLGFGNKQKRYIKNKAKYEENQLERENFESLSANAQLDSASGGAQGEQFQKADTDLTKGQQGKEEQKAEKKRLAEKAARDEARQNIAESEGVTTGQAGNAVGTGGGQAANAVNPGSSAGGMFDVGTFAPTDYSKILQGNSVAKKRGYGMKAKSVATKKLQGAPERTALKKSYFKNK